MTRIGFRTGKHYDASLSIDEIGECCHLCTDEQAADKEYCEAVKQRARKHCFGCFGCPVAKGEKK